MNTHGHEGDERTSGTRAPMFSSFVLDIAVSPNEHPTWRCTWLRRRCNPTWSMSATQPASPAVGTAVQTGRALVVSFKGNRKIAERWVPYKILPTFSSGLGLPSLYALGLCFAELWWPLLDMALQVDRPHGWSFIYVHLAFTIVDYHVSTCSCIQQYVEAGRKVRGAVQVQKKDRWDFCVGSSMSRTCVHKALSSYAHDLEAGAFSRRNALYMQESGIRSRTECAV